MTIGQARYLKDSLEYLLKMWNIKGDISNDESIMNEFRTCIKIIENELKKQGINYDSWN